MGEIAPLNYSAFIPMSDGNRRYSQGRWRAFCTLIYLHAAANEVNAGRRRPEDHTLTKANHFLPCGQSTDMSAGLFIAWKSARAAGKKNAPRNPPEYRGAHSDDSLWLEQVIEPPARPRPDTPFYLT